MNTNLTRVVLLGFLALAVAAGVGMGLGKETKIPEMSFFITSSGSGRGGDLGGLAGADARCTALAAKAHVADKDWHAYLSTAPAGGQPGVDARDRIGQGPWFNAKGVQIASSLADLHSAANNLNKQTAVDELGHTVKGRGDTPNTHDILTGSTADGRLALPAAGGPAAARVRPWSAITTARAAAPPPPPGTPPTRPTAAASPTWSPPAARACSTASPNRVSRRQAVMSPG
jgi:hypothetical protein